MGVVIEMNLPDVASRPRAILGGAVYNVCRDYVRKRKVSQVRMSVLTTSAPKVPYPDNVVVGVNCGYVGLLIPKSANTYFAKWLHAMELEAAGLRPKPIFHDHVWSRSPLAATHQLLDLPGGLLAALESPPYSVIAVVRDPVERLLSCYLDKRRNSPGNRSQRQLPKSSWENFDTWVEALSIKDRIYRNQHWAPQNWQIGDLMPHVEYIIPVPDISAQLSGIGRKRGLYSRPEPDPISHRTGAADVLAECVSEKAREMILEIYAADVGLYAQATNTEGSVFSE